MKKKNLYLIGGNVARECNKAKLVDEMIHLVHIILKGGIRLFDNLGAEPIELQIARAVEAPGVTHLKNAVVK